MANGAGPAMQGVALSDLGLRVAKNNETISDATDAGTRQRAGIVYRDLPMVTIQNSWSVDQARGALYGHMSGMFDSSAQLFDSILGDDRVVATMGSRVSGLFGRRALFKAASDTPEAIECMRAWVEWWPRLSGDSALVNLHTYGIGMGFAPAQLIWDTSRPVWGPYLRPWHPRFTYYDWTARRYIAIAESASVPIVPGDGKWVLHAPFGDYRGWIRGAVRAIAEPWMLRHFALRDMARFSEAHGMPTRVGMVPAVSDPGERSAFEQAIASLGSNTSMILPQGVDGPSGSGYDYKLVEARDTAWESFPGMIDRCDMSIILAIMFQNLTTEVKGGSFAATSAHMDIRQSGLQGDGQAWANTIYNQIARPFAFLNFGDADLAPMTHYDVEPRDEIEGNAKQFLQFGTAVEMLARGGVKFRDVAELQRFAAKNFGLEGLPAFDIGDPVSSGRAW